MGGCTSKPPQEDAPESLRRTEPPSHVAFPAGEATADTDSNPADIDDDLHSRSSLDAPDSRTRSPPLFPSRYTAELPADYPTEQELGGLPDVCEPERLATLLSLGVLDRHSEDDFDAITRTVKALFGVPTAAITLIAEKKVHMHSVSGVFSKVGVRKGSFCERILEGRCPRVLVVEDATKDSRFAANRHVEGPPGVRFYAGVPLVGSTGFRYGTLCIIDLKPRAFSAEQLTALCHFAELVTRELEREKISASAKTRSELSFALHGASAPSVSVLRSSDSLDEAVMLCDVSRPEWPLVYANTAWTKVAGQQQSLPFWHVFMGRAVDPEEMAEALAASRACRPFILAVRSIARSGHVVHLRFKPISEPGRLGAAAMPTVAIPAGLKTDWDAAAAAESNEEVWAEPAAASFCQPVLGRAEYLSSTSPLEDLSESKRGALADALTAPNSDSILDQPNGMAQITRAASVVAAAVDILHERDKQAKQERCPPTYYFGVVLWEGPPAAPSRRFPLSPFEACGGGGALGGSNWRQKAPFNISEVSPLSTLNSGAWPSTDSSGNSSGNHAGGGEQPAASAFTAATAAAAAPRQDSAASGASTIPAAVVTAPSKPASAKSSFMSTASYSWGMPDRPPAPLRDVVLGPMVGCTLAGRCYRAKWHGSHVAAKVVDLWEDSVPERSVDTKYVDSHVSAASGKSGASATSVIPSSQLLPSAAARSFSGGFPLNLGGAATLQHHHLVPVHASAAVTAPAGDVKRVHLQLWVIEQFCDRGSLSDAIERGDLGGGVQKGRETGGGRFLRTVLLTAKEVAVAMACLHAAGTVHGRLNANNVLRASSKGGERGWEALIADYYPRSLAGCASAGVAAGDDNSDQLSSAASAALAPLHRMPSVSAAYLPAESASVTGEGAITPQMDVFSFGVLLWEMWSGRRAWRALDPERCNSTSPTLGRPLSAPPGTPPALASLMERCMAEKAGQRPPFAAILHDLDEQLEHAT